MTNTTDGAVPAGLPARLRRERQTIVLMIGMYCRRHHGGKGGLCQACRELHDYAMLRLDRCRFGADKPTCVKCPVHCYKPDMRERVRAVMRDSGPRMLWRHPYLALMHVIDERKPAAAACVRAAAATRAP
ncbi:MAG: nitrous oxide-stimulated promoter family protein [Lentisphaerae bacterium]|nr:nitrous oxide-stimulated promoter family protein [Lentisphaerota bacterium]